MTAIELKEKIKNLRELNRMADEISAEIESIKYEIKTEMTEQNTDTLTGTDFKITWSTVMSNKFNTTKFKKDHSDLYYEYCEKSISKRFLLK